MFKLNGGALRRTTDDARSKRFSAANDLVRRTLAQHGLINDDHTGKTDAGIPPGPVLPNIPPNPGLSLSGLSLRPGANVNGGLAIADGADFRHDRFSCSAGSRAYRTYVPATGAGDVTGILVMLHGCTQTPEDFAAGTGINALAEKHRFVVIYPQQSRGDNAQSCWNWFSRGDQQRDRGEPAILAGLARLAMSEHGVAPERTFVAGLSAGAAMAVILGETYPDVFAGVGAHSGLPFGAARDVPSAYAAMAGTAHEQPGAAGNPANVRTIIFHGTEDATVHPSNSETIARHVLDRLPQQTIQTVENGNSSGCSFTRTITATPGCRADLEYWMIDGMGHAWSGGHPSGSFTDAKGPDASAEMIRFFFDTSDGEL